MEKGTQLSLHAASTSLCPVEEPFYHDGSAQSQCSFLTQIPVFVVYASAVQQYLFDLHTLQLSVLPFHCTVLCSIFSFKLRF